ncbi:MAG: AsmA-like C-terminal region-containing protein [Acidobacteriota bacterium]
MTVATRASSQTRHRIHVGEAIGAAAIAVAMIAVHLMFFFWPFRYRQVHPLLEKVFESKVVVNYYHRTYFPHPGFVAEGVTFFRHGDTHIPPLAEVKRIAVEGQWGMLLFHPHLLYQISLEGLHVRIPPAGTRARGMDFDDGVVDASQSKLKIETICADGTVLDFLRNDDSPIRFQFPALQIHDLEAGRPMQFALTVRTPGPQATVTASGKVGPFRTTSYRATPLSGSYRIESGDLSRLRGLAGHVRGGGQFTGIFAKIRVMGSAAIPDFRAGPANRVRLDAQYRVAVNGMNADVQIEGAQVRTGSSLITAQGSVAGSPRRVAVTFATQGAEIDDLLRMVEEAEPEVAGKVNLHAAAEFSPGPQRFLERLQLQGAIAVEGLHFLDGKTQQRMDAFSARVWKGGNPAGNSMVATLAARSETRFEHGVASFPDIEAYVPGAQASLRGTFDLLNSRIDLKGKLAMERSLSHAATGFKAVLLKPLSPFFKRKDAGAVLPITVTGTAEKPKVSADLF